MKNRVPLSTPIPVKLSPDTLVQLDRVSKRMGEPRSTIMRMAIRVGLQGLEKAIEQNSVSLGDLVSSENNPQNYPAHKGEYSTVEEASSSKDTASKVQHAVTRGLERIAAAPKAPKQ